MRIAILGATSQIAKDLVLSFSAQSDHDLMLFARRSEVVTQWLTSAGLSGRYAVADFVAFSPDEHFDAIINFVGVGNPAQAAVMGASIFDVTLKYDELALGYLRSHPDCRYVFLSSGAAYGSSFDEPVDENTKAVFAINNLQPQDWYAVAKMHAECRHRSLAHLPIVDVRVFNYFSHTQDMEAHFLITDIVRAIRDNTVLKISADYIVRDFISPDDFFELVSCLLAAPAMNDVVDCYSREPVSKIALLEALNDRYGLRYEICNAPTEISAPDTKMNYTSSNHRAQDYGYHPSRTALTTVLYELDKIDDDQQNK